MNISNININEIYRYDNGPLQRGVTIMRRECEEDKPKRVSSNKSSDELILRVLTDIAEFDGSAWKWCLRDEAYVSYNTVKRAVKGALSGEIAVSADILEKLNAKCRS